MEVKHYYLLGAGLGIAFLAFMTISSYMPREQKKVEKSPEAVVNVEVKEIKPEKEIAFEYETAKEDNEKYSVKIVKVRNLPQSPQTFIDEAYVRIRDEFLKEIADKPNRENGLKYVLDIYQPKKYETDKYISMVFEVIENQGGSYPEQSFLSLVYDRETGRIVTLAEVVGNDNRNNEIYDYLSTYFQSTLTNDLLDQAMKKGKDDELTKSSLKDSVKSGLNPEVGNFLVWYIEGDRINFVFPPLQVAPQEFGKQEAGIYLNALISALSQK
ncbi:MAG: hypothetical protein MNSN_08010 [Minisyncoccus archaeiphilus]|jgi:hypothetical protein|uniref:hypothetical protein n=1 Tax=Minisyncoccus archaeiphilus TaxID=3238481 RepID=UPI002B09004B|nr:MAG: hypothetical protein MNSN_08010 [Candidatus Parcubacteria bacterium]